MSADNGVQLLILIFVLSSAGAYVLSGKCLDAAVAVVRLKQAAWMEDERIAYSLTLTWDAWSNARMESVYSWNVIFPNRRVILLGAEDLSDVSHTGELLAGVCSHFAL